ncbi:hypothetical protein FLJU110815_06250 [Flavobacterium jumunjinense]
MLTDQEMKQIAEKYLLFKMLNSNIDIALYDFQTKKEYGNIYYYQSKNFLLTNDEKYLIGGNAPFLVEKATGRIVIFGTAYPEEHYIKAYENDALEPVLRRYWYPETETYSHK